MRSTRAWEYFGDSDPYFGVLTSDRFRGEVKGETLGAFFAQGEDDVARLMERVSDRLPARERALDFGCGVGRLTLPLAKHFRQVVGVDISPGMLAEAQRNLERLGVGNVSLARTLDEVDGSFDLVHSFIVLQHIEPKVGLKVIERMCRMVNPGGVLAIHVTYGWEAPVVRKAAFWIRHRLAPAAWVANLLKGRRWNEPMMQMNNYDLPTVFRLMRANGYGAADLSFTDHGGHIGAMIYAERSIPA